MKDDGFPMSTRLRRSRWSPVLFQGCPTWSRGTKQVTIVGDVSCLTTAELDYLFAIFASNGGTTFMLECSEQRLSKWMASVKKRSVGAAQKYERRMRAHFQKHKTTFRAGYTLPEPPTPELRLIYDSAAASERRDGQYERGFTGGEYHWRKWPLSNVSVSRKMFSAM